MTILPSSNCADFMNIILVEDDDADAKAVHRAFSKTTIANPVIRAVDGVEALALLRLRQAELPRQYMILTDINMPRMDGLELISEIRSDPALRRAVIFVLTTSDADKDLARAHELNVAGYILKKNLGQDLMTLIETLGQFWNLVELPSMKQGGFL